LVEGADFLIEKGYLGIVRVWAYSLGFRLYLFGRRAIENFEVLAV
jgi:hypothetical protein